MKYDGILMVGLLTFFLNFLNIILYLDLLLSPLQCVRVQQFAIECSHFLVLLEQLDIGLGQLLLLDLLLELAFLLIDASSLELLLLELFEAFFLLALLEILQVIGPLISPFLTFLEQVCCSVLFGVGCVGTEIQVGMRFALIFILTN